MTSQTQVAFIIISRSIRTSSESDSIIIIGTVAHIFVSYQFLLVITVIAVITIVPVSGDTMSRPLTDSESLSLIVKRRQLAPISQRYDRTFSSVDACSVTPSTRAKGGGSKSAFLDGLVSTVVV